MIGPVTRLPLICHCYRQLYSLTSPGKSSTTPTEMTIYPSVSLTPATSRPPLALPSSTVREQIGQPSVGLPAWIYLARTLTQWSATQHDPYYTPPRLVFRKLLQFTLSMEFHCQQALREHNRRYRHFSQQPSQANFIAYKKAMAQVGKVIRNAKTDSFREFISTVNRTTPLSKVWQTVNIFNNKKPYTPINNLEINNNVIDDKKEIANTIAQHFHHASSSAYYTPAFLPRKEEAELSVPNLPR